MSLQKRPNARVSQETETMERFFPGKNQRINNQAGLLVATPPPPICVRLRKMLTMVLLNCNSS